MTGSVFTGAFAPATTQEVAAICACDEAVVTITAADAARSSRLPWTAEEREAMLRQALGPEAERVTFRQVDGGDKTGRPDLLAALFHGDDASLRAAVPEPVFAALQAFRRRDVFAGLAEEARYIADYKASWAVAPYPVIFVTVDSVIVHDDPQGVPHVLLVKRGGLPGRGLYAVPGGFVDGDERLIDAALRELREETGLALSDEDALARLRGGHVFDDPQRSARGRTITHAFHFAFPAGVLPLVEGRDDAVEARWVPVGDLAALRGRFFEDHGDILRHFLAG